ncbi:MAG TPA: SIR2 family protein [Candidatus Limnocylindrales bacterium]|nr:SIR2 family protein [Candidatus Limnocylindrales bacterium]
MTRGVNRNGLDFTINLSIIGTMELSAVIVQSPLTLFLGAGASQPLGKPTMRPFVQALFENMSKAKDQHLPLFSHLAATCENDLENILGELDAIISLKSAQSASMFYNGRYQEIESSVARALRTAIEYAVIQQYSEIPQPQLVEVYGPLFELIFSKLDSSRYCLPIFTTNYDTAIEEFCELYENYHLVDGFRATGRDYAWDPAQFHRFAIVPNKRNIVLFKLHGSVNWTFVKSKNAILRTQPFHQMIDAAKYRNVLIYPATHKVATDEPFFTAYDYYGRCCEHAEVLLTIGYSFRDYDALARLRSAMSVNPTLRVALLAPDCKEVLQRLPIDHHREIPLELFFGNKATAAQFSGAISKLLSSLTSTTTSTSPRIG